MMIIKCKMCGGDVRMNAEETYGTCEHCGSTMTLPKVSDERKANLFNRANHFRRQNEFDKAIQAYENILNEDNADAEAHWGIVLSRWGIEYVEDPATLRRIPTCHRVQNESILADADYLAALEHAPDSYTRSLYEEEAKNISEIQKGILAISSREEPYDVFICYKEAADDGGRTKDSAIAQDIYYQLINDGYRVFFARITLEDKLGKQYEPYIFSALNSARVMLAIGTRKEHFESVWVKNEWRRFLAITKKDRSRLLIPCYRDMDAYDMPDELSNLQSQDMSKIGFIQDILRGVKKVLDAGKGKDSVVAPSSAFAGAVAAPGVESLMKRGRLFLEDSDWRQADEYFNKVLDIDPEYAPAYVGRLCAALQLQREELLVQSKEPLDGNGHFKKAIRFADADYRVKLEEYNKVVKERIAERIAEEKRKEAERLEKEKRKKLEIRKKIAMLNGCICACFSNTVGLKSDGTVVAVGDDKDWHQKSWRSIVAICSSGFHTVGLKSDGTVVAVGWNENGQRNTEDWQGIVAISCSLDHTVGLESDGTVLAVGNNKYGQCNTVDWRDIVAISCSLDHTVGLKSDGKVIAVGNNEDGVCNTRDWRDIVAIFSSRYHTVGLKSDGTVVAVGNNEDGVCNTREWRDIEAISCSNYHTVGLKSDGTVAAVGNNEDGVCNTREWRDIVAISCSNYHTVGLKSDGTVAAVGNNKYGQCNTKDWRDIVAIFCSDYHTVGLKSDGTVAAVGNNKFGLCNTKDWRDIGPVSEEKHLLRAQEDIEQWKQQGLCIHCGGKISFFSGKCKSCGKQK